PFCFLAVCRKKITGAFDGGRISSDGWVMLLAQADRRLGIAERLARAIPDARDPDRITHLLPDILRARIFAIACGYEDADDLDRLRFRSSVQAGVRPLAGFRPELVLTADCLALRECTRPARSDPPHGCHGRSLLRQLHEAAGGC